MGLFKHYGGMIGSLKLGWFWNALSKKEKGIICEYSIDSSGLTPIEGEPGWTSASQLSYLLTFLLYATSRQDYGLAERLIMLCNRADGSILDKHFFYTSAGDCYYNQAYKDHRMYKRAEVYYIQDVKAFPKYRDDLFNLGGGQMPYVRSFQRLSNCYEMTGKIEKAIDVCKAALDYGLYMKDTTEQGYQERINRLLKKMN